MERDPPHPIIKRPHEYRIVGLRYEMNWESPEESFLDLRLEKDGLVRNLRFWAPRDLKIEEGFPQPTGGMQILDVSSRQLEGVTVEVSDFEASWGDITFLARSVVDLDAVQTSEADSYLQTLKAFVEGRTDLREWPAWWQENALQIEEKEEPTYRKTKWAKYRKLETGGGLYAPLPAWRDFACRVLEHHGISYSLSESVNWHRCPKCGEILFGASPGETTQEQIREFARKSNLPEKDEIERDGWIHPGVYCPNGCVSIMTHL